MNFRTKLVLFLEHIYVSLFSFRRFDKKYFNGKLFERFCSPGWRYAFISLRQCRKKRVNTDVKWPCSADVRIGHPWNISFSPEDLHNFFSPGTYFQGICGIQIGKGTIISLNVGIISSNHDIDDFDKHVSTSPIIIGEKCWIGMNAIILPGTILGDHTIVGAGSVVTKSFPDGHCVIAGNPAKLIRRLDEK